MSDWTNRSITEFTDILATKSAVPGGGGTSALAGALGAALCSMVGNLTLGKKKYADVQDEVKDLLVQTDTLRETLLELVEQDAVVFEPLSKAYGLPKETEEQQQIRTRVMEECLQKAAEVPMRIMEAAAEGIRLHRAMVKIGSAIAISDVGVGVALCEAALRGAALNVYINTKLMKDREKSDTFNRQVAQLLGEMPKIANDVYLAVQGRVIS